MAALGYLYLRGVPFSLPQAMLPSDGQLTKATPQAIVRRGLIFDLNAPAAAAGIMLDSPVNQARQTCPDLGSVPFVEAAYEERMRIFTSALRRETSRFEFDAPNSLFIDFAGSGEPAGVLERLCSACPGFEVVAGLAPSKFTARAAVLAALATETYHRHAMYLPKPQPPKQCLTPPGRPGTSLRVVDLLTGDDGQACRAFLSALPVGYLWAVGEERRERA